MSRLEHSKSQSPKKSFRWTKILYCRFLTSKIYINRIFSENFNLSSNIAKSRHVAYILFVVLYKLVLKLQHFSPVPQGNFAFEVELSLRKNIFVRQIF